MPDQEGYVDAAGRPVQIPAKEGICTHVERDGRPVAVICHDESLEDESELVQAVGAAASIALENERLNAELRARVEELRASRARIVEAGDEERRRLERDLHDGAQQRLVALALNMRLIESKLETDPAGAKDLLRDTATELSEATTELRELARGLHPAILSDRGLRPALEALAGRAPLEVQLEGFAGRATAGGGRVRVLLRGGGGADERRPLRGRIPRVGQRRPRRRQRHRRGPRRRRRRRRPGDGLGTARAGRPGCGARRPAGGRQPAGSGNDREGGDPVRVIVAEDSVLLREGVVRLLEEASIEVVGQAGDAEELVRKVRAHKPDVAIVDVRMPPTNTDDGLRAAQQIRAEMPEVAVLVLSQYIETEYARELLEGGAEGVGYLLKDRVAEVERFIESVRRVAEGGSALDPQIVSELLGRRESDDPLERLTPREREVLELMAEGRTNHAIAEKLVVSERAVEKHITSIFGKLDLATSPEDHRRVLAVLAYLGA